MEASLTFYLYNGSTISSVGTVPDWRVGGRGFDSRGQTNTLGLKVTEQWRYWLFPENGSPVEGVKNSVPTSTFVLIHWLSNKVQFLFQVFLSFIIKQISINSASVSQKQKIQNIILFDGNIMFFTLVLSHYFYRTAVTCIGAIYEKLGRMVNPYRNFWLCHCCFSEWLLKK